MATVFAQNATFEPRSDMKRRPKTKARPVSAISDHFDTEFEDSDVEDEAFSGKSSFDSGRRRSETTISSFDELPTPDSSYPVGDRNHFDAHIKSIQGPRGPHLFRSSSQLSTNTFDYALQLSPLLPKEPPRRPETSFTEDTVTPTTRQRQDLSLAAALAAPELGQLNPEGQIRLWSPFQVVDWMSSCGVDPTIIECFQANDIDGNVLLDLEFDHLRDQLGIQSFGKRIQLWTALCSLRGEDAVASRQQTPFYDISRPCTGAAMRSSEETDSSERDDDDVTPIEIGSKKRRGRKTSKTNDTILPGESVSIVAIEQLIPKPHKCPKGERCSKWRKQQRELEQLLQDENGIGRFPISPTNGGRIHISGDPGNAATALNVVPDCRRRAENPYRHTADTVPSIIASSGLLSPTQFPTFVSQEEMLGQLGKRDPQDNVRQFLNLQHVHSTVDSPVEVAEPGSLSRASSVPPMFPEYHHQPYPLVPSANAQPEQMVGPRNSLQMLPRLEIPRSQSAASGASPSTALNMLASPCRTAVQPPNMVSPSMLFRLGSPQSEMDVPVTAVPISPVSRDVSQSVPANMQFRQPNPLSRSNSVNNGTRDLRRPSMPLPALKEEDALALKAHEIASSNERDRSGSLQSKGSTIDPQPGAPVVRYFSYGEDCSHAGWMKKRKTKLLRHEWQDGHFRLIGSQLSMHQNARISSAAVEKINVDDYGVACSTAVSSNKLSAAMKAFHIKSQNSDSTRADTTAFNFQLVPNRDVERKLALSGKTHHFAVKTKDDRIDWMREVMLAKALQQRGKGYDVQVNGERL